MGAAQILDLDKGTAAGLLAGATTESASIGTAGDDIGEETSNLQGLGVIGETRDVVITNRVLVGRALRTARRLVDPDLRRGVFVYKLNCIGQDIELRPGTRFQAGDIVTLYGPADALKQVAKMIGYSTDRDLGVDYVYLRLGIITGILIGMITVNIAGAAHRRWLPYFRAGIRLVTLQATHLRQPAGGDCVAPEGFRTGHLFRRHRACGRTSGHHAAHGRRALSGVAGGDSGTGALNLLHALRPLYPQDAPGGNLRCAGRASDLYTGVECSCRRRWQQDPCARVYCSLCHYQRAASYTPGDLLHSINSM